jgi:hypothetical protein
MTRSEAEIDMDVKYGRHRGEMNGYADQILGNIPKYTDIREYEETTPPGIPPDVHKEYVTAYIEAYKSTDYQEGYERGLLDKQEKTSDAIQRTIDDMGDNPDITDPYMDGYMDGIQGKHTRAGSGGTNTTIVNTVPAAPGGTGSNGRKRHLSNKKTRKHKTRKHKTRKHKTRKHKTRKYKTRKHKNIQRKKLSKQHTRRKR